MRREGKARVWEKHQKAIPSADEPGGNKWGFVRSCLLQAVAPFTEGIIHKVMTGKGNKGLGMDIRESAGHTSCGAIGFHGDVTMLETQMVVAARNFSMAHYELGVDNFFCTCVTSFGNYCEIIELWEHEPELLEYTKKTLEETTGRKFWIPKVSGGRPSVVHASDVIYANIKKLAKKAEFSLDGVKATDHLGCHYSKIFPDESVGGGEFPRLLAGMIEAYGGELVDYPERRHCCGMGFRQCAIPENRGYTAACVYKKMKSLKKTDPDCKLMITNCPGCGVFLDAEQGTIAQVMGEKFDVHVMNYAQLAGLMLGYDPFKDCGFNVKYVPIEPLLDKIGIPYDKSKTQKERRRPFGP